MPTRPWILAAAVLLMVGCQKDQPVTVDNRALGLKVTFPGPPKQTNYLEQTPLGPILWWSLSYQPKWGNSNAHFHVDIGAPKPDSQQPLTPTALVSGFQAHLLQRLGATTMTPLPPERGPGFSYITHTSHDRTLEGVVIVRRGGLHHAQGARFTPEDPALKAFLTSFAVAP